jgi:hypothetical protein
MSNESYHLRADLRRLNQDFEDLYRTIDSAGTTRRYSADPDEARRAAEVKQQALLQSEKLMNRMRALEAQLRRGAPAVEEAPRNFASLQ